MDYIYLALKALAGGTAAIGFAILFNTDRSSLLTIFFLGAVGIFIKIGGLLFDLDMIITSFLGAIFVGFLSYYFALYIKKPPLTIAIPSVIPMVPGIFLYRMMIGFVKLVDSNEFSETEFVNLLSDICSNGIKALFILCFLAIGISSPYLLFRKNSVHYIQKDKF
ncbi:threonine/serine exporter family protein [Marinifilum sp.]|uniref:threonine/serine exporter family protein n=1 Tax=Marinifilum sp. TaxID=2033137 RepID=UPI003BA9FF3F